MTSPEDLKLAAVSELGQDYLKAGFSTVPRRPSMRLRGTMLDEEASAACSKSTSWARTGSVRSPLPKELPDVASRKEIAEYYCELAAAEMIRSRRAEARDHLGRPWK